MATTPETVEQKTQGQPETGTVKEVPDTVKIPEGLTSIAKPTPSQITATVTDDNGKPMMQSPATNAVTVTVPADPQHLQSLSQGDPDDAITWFATFWLRMIKKALHYGWKIVTKKGD
jgi:hypothetical protein